MVKFTTSASGRRSVSGGHDLKSSQTYPKGFGEAIVRLYECYKNDLRAETDEKLARIGQMEDDFSKLSSGDLGDDTWDDSIVGACIKVLRRQCAWRGHAIG